MKVILLWVLFLSCRPAGNVIAQSPLKFSFTQYSTLSGLISNQVNSVIQDEEGYIWTGTTDGLQRFDGIRYRSFIHKQYDSTTIPSNSVIQLLLDKKKNLWIVLADGKIGIFDTKRFVFHEKRFKLKRKHSNNSVIRRLVTDESGNLFYLLCGNEVITWNEEANEFSYTHNFFHHNKQTGIADFIHQPGTQKYWISMEGGGIEVFNKATGILSYTGNNRENDPFIEINKDLQVLYNLFFDNKNRLWYVKWANHGIPEINCYDLNLNRYTVYSINIFDHINSYHEIRGFFQQRDGTVWIKGLLVFGRFYENEKKIKPVYNAYFNLRSIAYETVNCLYEDRENNIWVATDNNGLYRFNPSTEFFLNINHNNRNSGKPGKGSVMSFIPTKWGTVLAGTWSDGLYHYDRDFKLIPINIKGIDKKNGPFIWGMFASKDSNTIWMAAQPGIYRVNQEKRSAQYFNPPDFENRTVRQIAEDKHGNLWIGMQHIGVFKWTKEKGKKKFDEGIKAFESIPRVLIIRIKIDSKGFIWIVTSNEGVYVIDPDTDKVILHFHQKAKNDFYLPEEVASDVLEYDDSTVLITTKKRILKYNLNTKKSSFLGTGEVLSGFFSSMQKDRDGFVWLSTTTGLYRANIHKKIFILFNRNDGIENDQFTLASSARLHDGRMLFGSSDNFIVFNPSEINLTSDPQNVNISGFTLMNKSLNVDSLLKLKKIELDYKDNSLIIELSALNYTSACRITYKLEGLDKDWKISDNRNEAVYSYLPPGNYKFFVSTIDEDGNEGKKVIKLILKIKHPFWQTWWFYSSLALLFGGLLFWFDRERMKRKESILKMRSEIADDLHQEINTALGNINILSEMARLKADTEPQKSKEFIEQIHSKSHSMIIAMDDMLWSINPQNDSMANFILRFKEYIDALRNRHGVNIELVIDKKVKDLQLNMKLRKEIFWLFKGGISNAVITGAGNCLIQIAPGKGTLVYTLEFETENVDMYQLNNLRQRKELADKLKSLNALLDVSMNKSKAVFILTIPVE